MRVRWVISFAALLAVGSVVAVKAADHPDSKTQSIADGCSRTNLGLLGEAFLTQANGPHPTPFASWVYVNGDSTPKTVEGTALSTYTAGTDLFGVHDTYDLNIDVKLDPAYEHFLSTRNTEENPPQIHNEWEAGIAPLFAWPRVGDRVRDTGSAIWDCGHWRDKTTVADPDYIPGDPLEKAGIEPEAEGEEIEIHPIAELATWRQNGDFVPDKAKRPVHASRLDVAISNQGGKAKGIEECALLSSALPGSLPGQLVDGHLCSSLQKVAGRDYVYELKPPGRRPSRRSKLMLQTDLHFAHNAPRLSAIRAERHGDAIRITVPFSKVQPSNDVQDLGATWHAWWSKDKTAVHRFRVTVQAVTIRNNLDGDQGDDASNPSITSEGEWNMFVEAAGNWVNLHDPRPGHTDLIPLLGAVPTAKPTPVSLPTSAVPPVVAMLGDADSLHLFSDARECDQPGYIDCPTKNELATTGKSAGRTEISLPVNQLLGRSTLVTVHPVVCPAGTPCPEQKNPVGVCPQGCYEVTYRIDDVDAHSTTPGPGVVGDGTTAGTRVGAMSAASLNWWIAPLTRYGPAQEEENVVIARVIEELRRGA
jgi:hypothetical protein